MITIYWAGDSTVQTNDSTTYPQTGIGQVLSLYLRADVAVENHAKNGRSTKSFLDEGRLQPIEESMKPGDYLFIQFGHNDEKLEDAARGTMPYGAFQENLRIFIKAARKKGAVPVLITPLERRVFTEEGVLGEGAHGEYVSAMKEVAETEHSTLIDLYSQSRKALQNAGMEGSVKWFMHLKAGEYPAYPEGKTDNTHLKYEGAVFFAGLVAGELQKLGGAYRELLSENPDAAGLEAAILAQDVARVDRILMEEPSLIDKKAGDGTPLVFAAARTGSLEVVKYIVEYSRASMNMVDDRYRNILHFATESLNLELIRYLVERVGMSPVAGDRDLITPYDIAAREAARSFTASKKALAILSYYKDVVGFAYEDGYHNPIRTGFYPDPSIVRVGEDYYMVNSSFIYFPCIPISHSRDLLHWKIIGYAITNPEWAALDELEGGRGYWAPDISYYNGKFYICATYRLNDTGNIYRRQIVVSSDRPEGPYGKPSIIEEDGIDPSLFTDVDKKRYMLLNRGARILEVSEDAAKQIGPARLLFYGDHKRAPEGPHLLYKDGYYYLFEAEGGTGMGHRITVSRARTLFGTYEPCPYNPIMRQTDENAPIQRCGHGKPVQTAKGDWFMVYLCGRKLEGKYSMLGRETALDPITWTADGWPIVNNLQGPSAFQKKPCVDAIHCENAEKNHALPFPAGWMTPRTPKMDAIRFDGDCLYLKGSKYTPDRMEARNILLRRQEHFDFTAEVRMKLFPLQDGQESGLICYYDENTWVSLSVFGKTGTLWLRVQEHIGEKDVFHGERMLGCKAVSCASDTPASEGLVTLRIKTRGLERSFSVRCPGREEEILASLPNVYYLCDEGISMGKRFTGAMVGVYAVAGENDYTAEFMKFVYQGVDCLSEL